MGAGASFGLNLGHIDLDLAADGATGPESLLWLRPQIRLIPERPREIGPHLVLAGGALLAPEGVRQAASVGTGFDFAVGRWRPRAQASWIGWPGDQPWRALLSLGVVYRPPEKVDPVDVAEPTPPPRFDADLVWVPGPVCEWLPPDEASLRFEETRADPWSTPRIAPPRRPLGSADGPAVPQGDLVVSAHPGDVVSIDGSRVEVAPDGIAWASLEEGDVDVTVIGGGREQHEQLAIAAGATLWFSVAPPEDLRVLFSVAGDTLDPAAIDHVANMGARAGEWTLEVWGSYSAEGDDGSNLALAQRRATATVAALIASGVDADHVRQLEPRPPQVGLPAIEQRAAVVHAVPVGTP